MGFNTRETAGSKSSSLQISISCEDFQQKEFIHLEKEKSTLYDVLCASPTATREELKKRYVHLVKRSHPDAQIGRIIKEVVKNDDAPDFGKVVAAWKILGDKKRRKQYDRDLRAKEFSDSTLRFLDWGIEAFATMVEEVAIPAVSNMVEELAVPFFRFQKDVVGGIQKDADRIQKDVGQSVFSNLQLAFAQVMETGQERKSWI